MLAEATFLYNLFGFLYHLIIHEEDDKDDLLETEAWLEEITELEFAELQKYPDEAFRSDTPEVPRNTTCFHRTGVITLIEYPNIMIDGQLFFDISSCPLSFKVDDHITYLGYRNDVGNIIVTRILINHGTTWDSWDNNEVEETNFKIADHFMIAEVDCRKERLVILKDNDLKFSLDDVEGTMVPISGDSLELKCTVQLDEDNPCNISGSQVLKVVSFRPVKHHTKDCVVTEWNGSEGSCNHEIYFDKQCLPNTTDILVGQKVLVEAIESKQGPYIWRVIKLMQTGKTVLTKKVNEYFPEESSLLIEKERGLEVTHPIKFDKVDFKESSEITLRITNRSNKIQFINKWVILSKKRDSQINVYPALIRPYKLYPDKTFSLSITCNPKFLGGAKETLVIILQGFKIERVVEINVVNESWSGVTNNSVFNPAQSHMKCIAQTNKIRQNSIPTIPGRNLVKTPHFIAVKLGMFPIPDRVWSAVIGDSTQVVHTSDFNRVMNRIQDKLPCMAQDLNIYNYTSIWHNLLFMEEIQDNINIRIFDQPKTFLMKCQDYLGLEVNGLCESRPSIVIGDLAVVKDLWENEPKQYEGYVHAVKGNLILMKFQQQFQESYSGSDVSIEFKFSRTKYRKAHQAVNLAISNLGQDILFPNRLLKKENQLPPEKLNSIRWYNKKLNDCQKAAVSNILLGECRPQPYLIYGPPGTGKTITVIETIFQLLAHLSDCRILVATPSNSAANLITERLVENKKNITFSVIRVVAQTLIEGNKIPPAIKPYCATLDIAIEGTAKSQYKVQDGIRENCNKSCIGRQRVIIGTCTTLGTMTMLGFPKGHFTHIIVDEAGQATEPDIMIAMTLTDKDNGQIILAGDPMQLGPIVTSRYAIKFGMNESYLCRLLDTFPYQKDFAAFKNGFNDKLVTKLNVNYRSLKEVITLPSQMFYDGSLVPVIDRNQPWIEKIVTILDNLFETQNVGTGGIYVNGIRGENTRAEDSPSWYNRHEASMVAMTLCKLYKNNMTADEIGIITPYIAQIRYLRVVFESLGLEEPKMGTVEEFQGQERPLIIISTVRSSSSLLEEDYKHALGFVKNPKRLNVAITRARVAVLLVCDPHILYTDPLWSQFIAQAVNDDKYMGCDLPIM